MNIEFINNYNDAIIDIEDKRYILHNIQFPIYDNIKDSLNSNEFNLKFTYDYYEER